MDALRRQPVQRSEAISDECSAFLPDSLVKKDRLRNRRHVPL